MMKLIASSFFGFIKDKPRLFIEYVLIGIVLVLCGYSAFTWMQNQLIEQRLTTAESNLATVKTDNDKLKGTVSYLYNQRQIDVDSVSKLLKALEGIDHKADKFNDQIKALETKNEDVKQYLNTVIPDDLRGLLSKEASAPTSTGNSKAAPSSGTSTDVQTGS